MRISDSGDAGRITVTLAADVCALALAACGGESAEPDADAASADATPDGTADAGDTGGRDDPADAGHADTSDPADGGDTGPPDTGPTDTRPRELDAGDADGGDVHILFDDTSGPISQAAKTSSSWTVESVEPSSKHRGAIGAIRVDSGGTIHAFYSSGDNFNRAVRHATKSGGSWSVATVDSGASLRILDGGLGPNGIPRVLWADETSTLEYAEKSTGGWTVETVDTSARLQDDQDSALRTIPIGAALGLPGSGSARALSIDTRFDNLNVWTRSSSGWSGSTVQHTTSIMGSRHEAASSTAAERIRLAVDATDGVHLLYWDSSKNEIRYAERKRQSWNRSTVTVKLNPFPPADLWFTDVVLDSKGEPAFAYASSNEAYFARRSSGGWKHRKLTSNLEADQTVELATGPSGHPHLSYPTGSDYRHDWYDGSSWSSESVPPVPSAIPWLHAYELTVDSAGNIHVFTEKGGKQKHYAETSSGWSDETITTAAVSWRDIAVDASGSPHAAYQWGVTSKKLYYTSNSGGSWMQTQLGSNGGGYSIDLLLGSRNEIVMVHYSAATEQIEARVRASGQWSRTRLTNQLRPGPEVDAELDSRGVVHFAYQNRPAGSIVYQTVRP